MNLQDQPAYIIEMRAKPGTGNRLFELATRGMVKSGASDRFIILREDANPDVTCSGTLRSSDPMQQKHSMRTAPLPTNCAMRF